MADDPQAVPSLDIRVLSRLAELDEEGAPSIIRELGTLFLRTVPDQLGKVRAHAASREIAQVKAVAHCLKSSAGSLGAMRLSVLARKLEAEAGSDGAKAAAVDSLVGELLREWDQLRPALEAEIARHR